MFFISPSCLAGRFFITFRIGFDFFWGIAIILINSQKNQPRCESVMVPLFGETTI